MNTNVKIVEIASLGEPSLRSPLRCTSLAGDGKAKFVPDGRYVRHPMEIHAHRTSVEELWFEKAGARENIFFDPQHTRAAIVTCGGLCPGLNDVIRSLFLELHMNYGVKSILGIRHGYLGLNEQSGEPPIALSMEAVEDIHRAGGTILGACADRRIRRQSSISWKNWELTFSSASAATERNEAPTRFSRSARGKERK